jgi:hypothetical protein
MRRPHAPEITVNNPRLASFHAGTTGAWSIRSVTAVRGEGLALAPRLDHRAGDALTPDAHLAPNAVWSLRGVTSNERYVTNDEKSKLVALQEGLGRPAAQCAALIPLRKSAAWWALTQEQRRALFEAQSQHTRIGLKYLPAIARRLHHCRDLATVESFDFLTWFEYRPEDEPAFDELLAALRATPEWTYVDREVDIRLAR